MLDADPKNRGREKWKCFYKRGRKCYKCSVIMNKKIGFIADS